MTREERNAYYFKSLHLTMLEFAARLCNASEIEDEVLHEVALNEFREFYDTETTRGYWHPHLTESMADFEDDLPRSILLYQKALKEAKQLGVTTHGILISFAENLFNLEEIEHAETALAEAERLAKSGNDKEALEEVNRVRAGVSGEDSE